MGQINNDAPKVKTRVVLKHDTAINWSKATGFTPLKGEVIIYDIDAEADSARGWYVDERGRRINTVTINDTAYPMPAPAAITRIKIGNGIDNINVLPFVVDDFLIVHADFPADGNGNAQLTHFAPEIYEFVKLGRTVFLCENDSTLCRLVECSDSVAIFQTALWDDSSIVRYFVYEDHIEKCEMSVASCEQIDQLQSNIDGLTLVVTWSGNELDAASCDLETIHQHAGAGRSVVFHKTTDRAYYPLAMCTDTFALFNGGITDDYLPQLTRFNINAAGKVTEYTTDLVCHYEFEDITKPKVLFYDSEANELGEEFETIYGMLESGNTIYISYDGEFLLHLEGYNDERATFGGVVDEPSHYQRLEITPDNSIYASDYYIADYDAMSDAIDNINLTLANRNFTTQQKQNALANLGITEQINAIPLSHAWDGTVLSITSNSGTSSVDLQGQPGIQGFGIVTAVARDAFTEAKWAEYGIIGDTESWTGSSAVRNGCRVGDIFMVYGTATDSGNAHVLYFKNTTSSGDLGGPCIAHSVTMKGSKGDKGDRGITFTPNVTSDGTLSWTNDGGLTNPATVNIKGGKGDKGVTFTPKVTTNGALSWSNDGGLTNPTTVNIKGPQGDPGTPGTSVSVTSVTQNVGNTGLVSNTVRFSDGKSVVIQDGVGISAITQTKSSSSSGGTNEFTVYTTDGNSTILTVKNGNAGQAGTTPVKGSDYFTDAEITEIEDNTAEKVAKSLPGENMLNFYDPNLIDVSYCNAKNIPGWQVRLSDDVYDKSNEFFSGNTGMTEHKEITFKPESSTIDIGIQTASSAHTNKCKISNVTLSRTDGQPLELNSSANDCFYAYGKTQIFYDTFSDYQGWSGDGILGAGSGYGDTDSDGLNLSFVGWNGVVSKSFSVTPGTLYTINIKYKVLKNGLNISILSKSGAKLATGYFSSTDWATAAFSVLAADATLTVSILGSGNGTATEPDRIYLDSCTIWENSSISDWNAITKTKTSNGQTSISLNNTARTITMKSSWAYWNNFVKIPVAIPQSNINNTYVIRFKASVTSGGVNIGGENLSFISRPKGSYINQSGYYIASFQSTKIGDTYITFGGTGASKDNVTISEIQIFDQLEPFAFANSNARWITSSKSTWCGTGAVELVGDEKTYSYGVQTLAIGVTPNAEYKLSFDIEYTDTNTYTWMPYITFTDEDKIAFVTDDCIPTEYLQLGGPWVGSIDPAHIAKIDIEIPAPTAASGHIGSDSVDLAAYNPTALQFVYGGNTLYDVEIIADITLYDSSNIIIDELRISTDDLYNGNCTQNHSFTIPFGIYSKKIKFVSAVFTPVTPSTGSAHFSDTNRAYIKQLRLFGPVKLKFFENVAGDQRLFEALPSKAINFYNRLTAPLFVGSMDDGCLSLS